MSSANPIGSSIGNGAGKVNFFTDEDAFREFVRFVEEDGTIPAEIFLADIAEGKVIDIDKNTPVRIVEKIAGGAKVNITSGPLAGKVGFMLAAALAKEPPSEQPYGMEA